MKFKQNKEKERQIILDVDLDESDVAPYYKIGYKKLVKKINIPGFRKGKAPYGIIESQYGKESLLSEAMEDLISDKTSEAIKESELESYMTPKIELINFSPIKFKITLPLQPKIEIGDISKIKLDKISDPDFDKLIDEQIANLQKQFTTWNPVEKKSKAGDLVNINIIIKIKETEVLNQPNTDIVLEEQNDEFAPGLIKNLIGQKSGDNNSVELKISKTHPSEELADKKGLFDLTINSVKSPNTPKLNAEFANMVSNNEIKTMATLRKKIQTSLEETHKQQTETEYTNNSISQLVEISKIEIPPLIIERETESEIQNLENLSKQFKMSLEEYLNKNNQNLDETKTAINTDTISKLNRTFLLLEVCKQNNIEPTDKEIVDTVQLLVNQKSTNSQGTQLSKDELRAESEYRLKLEKASKFLFELTLKNIE
jgi:trigger factor